MLSRVCQLRSRLVSPFLSWRHSFGLMCMGASVWRSKRDFGYALLGKKCIIWCLNFETDCMLRMKGYRVVKSGSVVRGSKVKIGWRFVSLYD